MSVRHAAAVINRPAFG